MLPIIVPYTRLYRENVAALPEARFVEIKGDDGYRLLLRDLWAAGEPFVLVEHDVAPTARQIQSLNTCDRAWCHYGYVAGDWAPKFGCVRFSSQLIQATQGVWNDPSWPWGQLDARFMDAAVSAGFLPHWHSPHVLHLRNAYFGADGKERRMTYDAETQLCVLTGEIALLREMIV